MSNAEHQTYRADMFASSIGMSTAKREPRQQVVVSSPAQVKPARSGEGDFCFSDVAEAVTSVSAAQWAMDNGYHLRSVEGGWCCDELPDVNFYDDGTWNSAKRGKCGGALEFELIIEERSLEEGVVQLLQKYHPELLRAFRERPRPHQKPDIELMRPEERIAQIKYGASQDRDDEREEREDKRVRGRLHANEETARAAAEGRDSR